MLNIKKIISLILLSTCVLSSLAACSSNMKNDNAVSIDSTVDIQSSSVETSEIEDYYPDITNIDLNGTDLGMLYFSNLLQHGWQNIPTDMNPIEETGDILNDIVYLRNRDAESKVNIVINEYPAKSKEAFNDLLKQCVMSGDDIYDLGFQSIVGISGLIDDGLLRDINTVGVNTDAPWYDHNSIESLTIADKLFYVINDISFYDKLSAIVTFFNKSIAENYNMDDFYQKVADGEWTYEYMLNCAEQISMDLNGDGQMDMNDTYGILCQNDGSYFLLHAAGLNVSEQSEDGLRFTANDERFITALQDIFDLMSSDLYMNVHKFGTSFTVAMKVFLDNRNLFMIRPIQSVFSMRDMEADFGIIPMPRYFEDDSDYHTPTNIYSGIIMCVPKNPKNNDYIALVTDLLAAESHEKVMPVLYDVVLDSKLSRDDITSKMLDIVFENRTYDPGLIWDIGGIRTTIVTSKHLNISSTIASITEKAEVEIAELYDAFVLAE